MKSSILKWLSLLLVLPGLCGCGQAAGSRGDEEEKVGLIIRALNYTDIPIGIYYVEDQWMGAVMSYNGGGSQVGGTGFAVPRQWRPGLKVRIDWRNDLMYAEDKEALRTDIVEIEPYAGKLNYLFVAFLPCNRIKVFASKSAPGGEGFPDPSYVNPYDYCANDARCRATFIDDTDRKDPETGIYRQMTVEEERQLLERQKAWQAEACLAVEEGRSPL